MPLMGSEIVPLKAGYCLIQVAFKTGLTVYAIFNDQSFKDTLTNDIVSFEQLSPGTNGLLH